MKQFTETCGPMWGPLPPCTPLATSRVPDQLFPEDVYGTNDAMSRGTLFPGLNLPFRNIDNNAFPGQNTRRGDLMALDFAARELQLYLDTHPEDKEAFALLKRTLAFREKALGNYTENCGPLRLEDMGQEDRYTWLNSPWPWERGGED